MLKKGRHAEIDITKKDNGCVCCVDSQIVKRGQKRVVWECFVWLCICMLTSAVQWLSGKRCCEPRADRQGAYVPHVPFHTKYPSQTAVAVSL